MKRVGRERTPSPHPTLLFLLVCLDASPAFAQWPRCGFGEGLAALREAERALAAPVTGLAAGREAAAAIHDHLRGAATVLADCACRRAAEDTAEAATLAETATAEHSAARIAAALERARFSLRLARERLGREGCS